MTAYVFPRQIFTDDGDPLAGPPGLSCRFCAPVYETGTYVAVIDPHSRPDQSMIYECDCAYDCFHPEASWQWRCMGRLSSILGFIETVVAMKKSLPFFDALTNGIYRTMHVLKAGPDLVYMRVRSDRMPANFFVCYRILGINSIGDWHRGGYYRYDGIMTYDEANAAIDRDAAAMGPVGQSPAAAAMGPVGSAAPPGGSSIDVASADMTTAGDVAIVGEARGSVSR